MPKFLEDCAIYGEFASFTPYFLPSTRTPIFFFISGTRYAKDFSEETDGGFIWRGRDECSVGRGTRVEF